MRAFSSATVLCALIGSCFAADAPAGATRTATTEGVEFFKKQVLPVFKKHCFKCHGGAKVKGNLRLNTRAGLMKGGDLGPAVNLKRIAESPILEAINWQGLEMPPSGKLPKKDVEAITRWVKMGAPYPADMLGSKTDNHAGHGPPQVNAKTKSFWSFQRVKRPAAPKVKNSRWVTSPIDAFIVARLEAAGLQPVSPASKTQLLRRVYYDLIGLPPSPDEVREFLADDSPDAYEKVVDRLLKSPHYGEKWGRHWLDVVRYAETNSYERDGAKPFVWKYRDYVIRSFNEDKPYTQFIREQLAGDELDEVTPDGIIATGYYRLGRWDDEPVDPLAAFYDDMDDVLMVTGQAFLGLTINCARCHDHKIDPIPQADYYSMLAFFRNVRRYGVRGHNTVVAASVRDVSSKAEQERHAKALAEHQRQLRAAEQRLREIEKTIRPKLVGVDRDDFKHERYRIRVLRKYIGKELTKKQFDDYVATFKSRDKLRREKPRGGEQALCVKENGSNAPQTHVLIRGNAHVNGKEVQPAFVSVLSPPKPDIKVPSHGQSTGRRRALAEWIVSENNPLTARVMVNRIWQHHFGRGIVRSSNDFGFQGRPPTHPQLLDWLAAEFVQGGWKLKSLHKQIVMSSTYRMSSAGQKAALAKDPANNLFWRFNMRRLTAEEIRDSILAVNGGLNLDKLGGPSIYTIIPQEVLAGQSRPGAGWGTSPPEERNRRSVYIHVKRSLLTPVLESFDFADTDGTCPVRFVTTQPTQALGMLNSDFIARESAVFAEYLQKRSPGNTAEQVRVALTRVYQRTPTASEISRGEALIGYLKRDEGMNDRDALKNFCVVALNLNEFLYLD